MQLINTSQKYAIYLFFFSLNFETMNLLNLDVNYLASKFSVSILLLISLINFKSLFSLRHFPKYLIPILIYFALLTVISFKNMSSSYNVFFDFQFFLNIIIFFILTQYSKSQPNVLLKGLLFFALGAFLLSLFYFLGIDITDTLDGRFTVFESNQNDIGLGLSISIFVLVSLIVENRLELGRYRFLLFFLLPFLFLFMIATGSRVAFISFVLGISIFLYYSKSVVLEQKILLVLTVFFAFILFWQFYLKNSLVAERLLDTVSEGDLSSRDLIWISAFGLISNNLFWGVGQTGYSEAIEYVFGGFTSPHNVIIEVICYTGIIGLTIFLIFFFQIARNAFKRSKYWDERLPIVLIIPILGMLLSGQIFDKKIVWGIFAFIVSISPIESAAPKPRKSIISYANK